MIFTPGKSRKIIHCNLMQSALGVIQNPLCAVVIHNTKSCSNVAWSAFQSLSNKYREITGKANQDGFLFCTGLTNRDAVFGGNDKLRCCLMDISEELHPEVILVICGCVLGIIGDDVEALCQEVENKTGIPIVLLPGNGFMVPGLVDTITSMSRILFDKWTVPYIPLEKRTDTCLVAGLSPSYSSKEEYQELMKVLRILGFKYIICPPVGTGRSDYVRAASASMVISFTRGAFLEKASIENAYYMANRLDIPFIDWNHIITPEKSQNAFMDVARFRNKEDAMKTYCCEQEKRLFGIVEKGKWLLNGKSCQIRLRITRQVNSLLKPIEFLREMGIEDISVILSDMISHADVKTIQSIIENKYSKIKMSRKESSADILLTSTPFDLRCSKEIMIPHCIGYAGWIDFFEKVLKKYGESHV